MTSEVRAIPVYTAKDYPRIRQLAGADDMPATWEEWHTGFEASKAERLHRRDFTHAKVLVRPGKFKAWLDENSFSATEHTRQLYVQERLDSKRAREEGRRELEQMLIVSQRQLLSYYRPPSPRVVHHEPFPKGPIGLIYAAIGGLCLGWLAHRWLG
ncbi:hypothetical protein FJ934_20160 [Mesorhizobium sp. B2-4-12]|uniref:hypothetical protein n=1 Tax=unclassified Mesorhizobium TaxID=325217 RepID=UPI0011290692|nr:MULTISPECIES: hypothetical protein [unclassified Mesorhizobium]TPK92759.1 hypothetical protein FJ934_20160 [Mesorhizobium sp. B2-4-12]UCI29515.1 hypothetical protein FJW03_16840 [Mesorhizobium sp. B4-1-4]